MAACYFICDENTRGAQELRFESRKESRLAQTAHLGQGHGAVGVELRIGSPLFELVNAQTVDIVGKRLVEIDIEYLREFGWMHFNPFGQVAQAE